MSADQLAFLQSKTFAVAGASNDRQKYGNIVYRALVDYIADDEGRGVYPLNPNLDRVESVPAYPSVKELPGIPDTLSIVTQPAVTRHVVAEAIAAGVKQIWMQPGAEDDEAIRTAREADVVVIAGGPCILVAMKTIARR